MATRTLSSPTLLASGCQITLAVSGGTWSTITVDPTKIAISLTSEGFDSSGVLGTVARSITIVSATHSAGVITCNLSEPTYDDDTAVSITAQAGAMGDGTDTTAALGSTSVDIASTPSTLDYPGVCAWHWGAGYAPHQRHVGTVAAALVAAAAQGIACVKFGLTQETVITTNVIGISGTLVYGELVTFSGGSTARVAAGSDLSGGTAKTVRVYMVSGPPPAGSGGESGTGAGGAAFICQTVVAGEEISQTVTALTTRVTGANGLATRTEEYAATLSPTQTGRYRRWAVIYPIVGDTALDSRNESVRSASNVMDGYVCRGADEIYCDPADAEASKQKGPYYVRQTSSAAVNSYTGTFGSFEYCAVATAGSLSAVVIACGSSGAGTQSSTPFVYAAINNTEGVYQMTLGSDPSGGTPAYGDIIVKTGTYDVTGGQSLTGMVLGYNAGTKVLTYLLRHGTNFADTDTLRLVDQNGASLGITFTATAPSSAIGSTVSSGDVVTGYGGGATCTLTGAPAVGGNDSTGDGSSGNPFFTVQRAIKQAATDRGDSRGDGALVYCMAGTHMQQYSAGNDVETRDYWAKVTRDPTVPRDLVRITRYNPASSNGWNTNFVWLEDLTIWNTSAQSGINTIIFPSSGGAQGSYDRPALFLKDVDIKGFFRWQLGGVFPWATSNAPYWSGAQNVSITRSFLTAHSYIDCDFSTFSNDLFTQGRLVDNCKWSDINANGTGFHCDAAQFQATEKGNFLMWGGKGKNLGFFQGAPFCNAASGSLDRIALVNVMQAADDSANISQMGNASGAGTFTISNVLWLNCTLADGYAWRANAAGRKLTVNNAYAINSVWTTHTKTETDTISGIFPAFYANNHFITNPGGLGLGDTTGSTLAALMAEATDNDAVGFLVPASGLLLNRDSARLNGWPTRDVYGRKLSTDDAAKAAIGAAQPIPVTSVTLGGVSFVDSSSGALADAATPQTLRITNSGPTGSVLEVTSVTGGGGITATGSGNAIAGASPAYIDVSATIGSSPGTVTITAFGVDDFDFTATWGAEDFVPPFTFALNAGTLTITDAEDSVVCETSTLVQSFGSDGSSLLTPTITLEQKTDGCDLVFSYNNTSGSPKQLGRIQVNGWDLGTEIEGLKHWTACTLFDVDTDGDWNAFDYPGTAYSPIAVLRAKGIDIGLSLLMPKHERYAAPFSPVRIYTIYDTDEDTTGIRFLLGPDAEDIPTKIAPAQTLTLRLCIRILATSTDPVGGEPDGPQGWIRTLAPYRDYFRSIYGKPDYRSMGGWDGTPVYNLAIAQTGDQDAGNKRGWRDGFDPTITDGFNKVSEFFIDALNDLGISRCIITAISGMHYDEGGGLTAGNYPFRIGSGVAELGGVAMSTVGISIAEIKQVAHTMIWWGRSMAPEKSAVWDVAPAGSDTLTPDDPATVAKAYLEGDYALRAWRADGIGLDAFGNNDEPWVMVAMIDLYKRRWPGKRILGEMAMPDFVHVKVPSYIIEQSLGENDEPYHLANYINPGSETLLQPPSGDTSRAADLAAAGYVPVASWASGSLVGIVAADRWTELGESAINLYDQPLSRGALMLLD